MFDGEDPFANESFNPEPQGPDMGAYADDAKYYAGQGAGAAKETLKKAKPFIIIGVIILIILIGVGFYLGMQQEVIFNISEYEGSSETATLVIYSGSNPVYGPEKDSLHKVVLMNGEYRYTVTSSDHKTKRETFNVDPNNKEINIKLEKDIEADISIRADFEKIYAGQTLEGSIIIDNITTDIENAPLKFKDSKGLLDVVFNQEKITVNNGGIKSVNFTLSVNPSEKLSKTEETKLSISFEGTKINDSITLNVNPTVKLSDLTIKGSGIKERTKTIIDNSLEGGEKEKPIIITIENDDRKIDIEDLELAITPDSRSTDKLSWFEFANFADEPNKTIIDKIEKNAETSVTLKVSVPITASINDEFTGKLTIKSDSLADDKEYIINMRVSKEKSIAIELSKTEFSSDCTPQGCSPISFPFEKVFLENDGTVQINNILIEVDEAKSYPFCIDWFNPQSETSTSIEAKGEYPLNFIITPTYEDAEGHTCYLKWTFDNPITNQRETELSYPINIKIKYDEA